MYVTKLEMNSAIEQTAESIELSVNKKLEGYSTTQEMQSAIEMKADSIELKVNNTLKDYSTTTQMNSAITQKTDSITQSVSATYATKTSLESTSKTLTASIELKINKKDLVSELNASADIINLKSNRLIIDSTYFKLSANGNITATSGTIGGFTLGATTFTSNVNGIYDYNPYDANIASLVYFYDISLSSNLRNLYDVNKDGEIDIMDADDMFKIYEGKITNNNKTTGIFKIDTANPKNFISVKNGNDLAVSIGVGGINTYLLGVQNIVCCAINNSVVNKQILISGKDASIRADGEIFSGEGEVQAKPKNLYDNDSGTTGTVTLSENVSNYKYIEIFYKDCNSVVSFVKVYSAQGKEVVLSNVQVFTNAQTKFARTKTVKINASGITTNTYGVHNSWNNSIENKNDIYIYKVVGYK